MTSPRFSPLHPRYISEGLALGLSEDFLSAAHLPITRVDPLPTTDTVTLRHAQHPVLRSRRVTHRPIAYIAAMAIILLLAGLSYGWAKLADLEHKTSALPAETARDREVLDSKIRALTQAVTVLVRQMKPAHDAISPAPAPKPLRSEAITGTIVSKRAALYSSPSPSGPSVMHLPRGTRVLVERQLPGWVEIVTPRGTSAYVSAEAVSIKE
jgi:hypothetical protein